MVTVQRYTSFALKAKENSGVYCCKRWHFFVNCGKLLTLLWNITMGKQAINVSSVDVRKLLDMLNAALSEEWLAYYQYWIGARLMEGPMRSEVETELLVHANEELAHAELVANRIIQLGGTPVINPSQWTQLARCPYDEPSDPYIEVILEQNLKGERCAIQRYQEIADFCNGKDHSTHQMAVQILNDELEHENDIEDWLTDLNRMKEEWKKIRL